MSYNMYEDLFYGLPEMKSGGQHGGLDRWFAEKWVDVKSGKECGRQEGEKRKGYPACRPSKRVSEDTPKTSGELSSAEKEKFKREKTSSKRIDYQHRRREFGGEETYDIMNEFKSGGNVPTNPALWSKAKAAARAKYDVYPSAYANGFAAKWYKSKGGGWRKAEYGMEVMGQGGVPDNAGFNALPDYVQDQIVSNMAQGGAVDLNAFYNQPRYIQTNIFKDGGEPDGSMAMTQINAMMDRLQNLRNFITEKSDLDPWISDKLSVMNHSATAINDYMQYGDEGGQEEPEMKNGGYTVTRSNDRKGKTHKVTGPDGTVKYFGDSKLGQHPKDPERKAAFYARHKENLEKNPYFRAFARKTWEEGGPTPPKRSLTPIIPQLVPGVNDAIDFSDIMMGAWNGDKNRMNQGVIGMAAPGFAGKAVPAFLDYTTEKMLGKNVADNNQNKREGIMNLSTADLQKLYLKYGPGGYDKWKAAGFPKLADGGELPYMAYGDETPLVFTPEAQKQFAKSNASWGYHGDAYKGPAGNVTPALPAGVPMFYADVYNPGNVSFTGAAPVSGQPFVPSPIAQPTIKADVYTGQPGSLTGPAPVSGQPFEKNMSTSFAADAYKGESGLTGPMTGMGNDAQLPANDKMQYAWTVGTDAPTKVPARPNAPKTAVDVPIVRYPNAKDEPWLRQDYDNGTNGLWNNRTYDALSMMAMLPLGNRGLAGVMKAGIGAAGFAGGLGTGVDNIYRGFKPRVSYANSGYYASPAMMQENPVDEMKRKENTPFTPPRITPGIPAPMTPRDEMRNTAAYGGQMPQYDFAGPVEPQRRFGLDPDGVSRMLGAASGLGMINDVVGYNQAFNNLERDQVRAGMSDMRGVSNPYMPQGYDVLNTGPGQTQAPNLYTPVQFAGNRNAGFFEEGGEYEMTEEQLRQFLANGGEVEYL